MLLPECSADFLLPIFLEIGPVIQTGLGAVSFGFREVAAWQTCIGHELPPWQARILVDMSREYASFNSEAEKPECPSPLDEGVQSADRRDAVFKALRGKMRGLISKPKRGKIRRRKKGA